MKRKFAPEDCVKLSELYQGKYEYGYLDEYDRKSKDWLVRVMDCGELIHVAADKLTYMPTYVLTAEFLKKILRYEYTYADYKRLVIPEGNWKLADENEWGYEYTLEDMLALIANLLEKQPTEQDFSLWAELILWALNDVYTFEGELALDETRQFMANPYPINDAAMAWSIFAAFHNCSIYKYWTARLENIDLKLLQIDADNYKKGRPIKQHLWSTGNMLVAMKEMNEASVKKLRPEEKEALRGIILWLAEREHPMAVDRLANEYYGGGELFPCDWEKSRDCFLQLMDMDDVSDLYKCRYANALGYIYYYGRCSKGVPDYEKAFQYYALGAAGGLYESVNKLSDMYAHGYGVPKNTRAAETLANTVYTGNLSLIKRGRFDCNFADAALRMGNLCRDGIIKDNEYYYYTVADFAIRKRASFNFYGDATVFSGIQKELARIRERRPLKNAATISSNYVPRIFEKMFDGHSCRVTLRPVKKGIKLTAERLPAPGKDAAELVFDCETEYGYCELVSEASVTAIGDKLPQLEEKRTFIADGFDTYWHDGARRYGITHYGAELFCFTADKFTRRLNKKSKKELREYRFASVVFTAGGRSYDYICELPEVEAGDRVIVFANGEEKEVEVVRLFNMSIGDMPLSVEKYKKILRKV